MDTNGSEADVSIGTEIPNIDDEAEDQESVHSYNCTHSANPDEADDQGSKYPILSLILTIVLLNFRLLNLLPIRSCAKQRRDDGISMLVLI